MKSSSGTEPPVVRIRGKHFRIVATQYPIIEIFERHVPPELISAVWELEAETNPRMIETSGNLSLIKPEDRLSGPGASIALGPFIHTGRPSRFSDGTYGVYYAGRSLETGIRETVHHREIIASDAGMSPAEFHMRVWVGTIAKSWHDIRTGPFEDLHDSNPRPEDHPLAQAFGKRIRAADSWGIIYRSVRHRSGECLAGFRPPAIGRPQQAAHLVYAWNGDIITQVYEQSEPILEF